MDNPKIPIDMVDFLRTGEFGPVKLGMTRTELLDRLGEPDSFWAVRNDFDSQLTGGQPIILKWGDIEFHFGTTGDRVWLIFTDNFTGRKVRSTGSRRLASGRRLDLSSWTIREAMSPDEFQQMVEEAGLTCQELDSYFPERRRFQTPGGVITEFLIESGPGDPPLGLCIVNIGCNTADW